MCCDAWRAAWDRTPCLRCIRGIHQTTQTCVCTTTHTDTDALYQIVYPSLFLSLAIFLFKPGHIPLSRWLLNQTEKMTLQTEKLDATCTFAKLHSQSFPKIARWDQFKHTFPLAGAEFVWPSMQTLVSRFDWVEPGILGPTPLIPTSPCLHCSLQVSIFCLCHWFVFWSVRVIYLHGIVFLSVPPQEIWNEAGLTLPGPNKARELISCILMLFVKTTHTHTHTHAHAHAHAYTHTHAHWEKGLRKKRVKKNPDGVRCFVFFLQQM